MARSFRGGRLAGFRQGWVHAERDRRICPQHDYQEGQKGAPLSTTEIFGSKTKYWDWPAWNVGSIYEHSTTRIGDSAYINTKAYYNIFDNTGIFYDNYTLTTKTSKSGDDSYYHDKAYGGSVEAGTDVTKWDTLKGSFNYRRDIHSNYNVYYNKANWFGVMPWDATTSSCTEPTQTDVEDVYSAALENTFHLTRKLDLVGGVSYDYRTLLKAEDVDSSGNQINYLNNPNVNGPFDSDAFNWQSAIVYRYAADAKLYASVSDRTRFPTLFERFSTKFNTTIPNPGAREASTNYEIGWAGNCTGRTFRRRSSTTMCATHRSGYAAQR